MREDLVLADTVQSRCLQTFFQRSQMQKNRDCDEETRVEGTRRKNVNFKTEDVKRHFQDNLKDIKDKFSLAANWKSEVAVMVLRTLFK